MFKGGIHRAHLVLQNTGEGPGCTGNSGESHIALKFKILTVGKLKEKYWQAAANEHVKRIRRYADIKSVAVKEAPQHSLRNDDLVKQAEAEELSRKLTEEELVIALDKRAQQLSSEKMAEFFQNNMLHGNNRMTFVIGGPLGLSDDFLNHRVNRILSLSEMTFPHELAKVIVLEQIYRALTILEGGKYHK